MTTTWQTESRSNATSKLDRSRRPPFASARTLPNSRVQRVAMRDVSDQSVPRTTRASAFSAGLLSLREEPGGALGPAVVGVDVPAALVGGPRVGRPPAGAARLAEPVPGAHG